MSDEKVVVFESKKAHKPAKNHPWRNRAPLNYRSKSAFGSKLKVTPHIARSVWEAYLGGKTQKELAELYGLSQPTISRIIKFRRWQTNPVHNPENA